MRRCLIALAVLLAVLTPFLGSSQVSAEPGCSVSAYVPYVSGSNLAADGSFTCGYNDPGYRQLQVCIKFAAGGNAACSTAYPSYTSYTLTTYSPKYCLNVYTWVWMYGEDGSTTIAQTGSVKRC